VNRYRVARNTR